MKKITSLLHSNSDKKWNNLKKGDKLYILIPENINGIYKYTYQTTEVISIKEYALICNVRFKYTDNGKRKRVNLAVNKLKYNLPYLAIKRNTEWASDYTPIYGDTIVIMGDNINDIYTSLIVSEIEKQEQIIEVHKKILNTLRTMQYDKII